MKAESTITCSNAINLGNTMLNLLFNKIDKIGILTINRPDALNALNRSTLIELEAFLEHDLNQSGILALIITGAGNEAFIAGGDVKEMNTMSPHEMHAYLELGQRVTFLLEESDKIIMAALNGFALGGGLEIALSCDFVYAKRSSKIGLPEVKLGLIPGFGGTQRLLRAIGVRRAKEWILSGQIFTAVHAYEIGLVNKLFDDDELMPESLKFLREVLGNSHCSIQAAKQIINQGADIELKSAMKLEIKACESCFSSSDRLERMSSFIHKRSSKA